jgi:hypothetical protein
MRDLEECRPYVDHLLAEHRRVRRMIGQAHRAIVHSGGPDHDVSVEEIVRVLRLLREELAHHFREEEAGGCLDEAASMCPRLSPEVQRLAAEHAELLAAIDALIAHAHDLDQSILCRIDFGHSFDNLCRQLHAHEAAENAVLRQGFGTNVNGEERAVVQQWADV